MELSGAGVCDISSSENYTVVNDSKLCPRWPSGQHLLWYFGNIPLTKEHIYVLKYLLF